MGNALRLFVFCLALAVTGSSAALSQLWVRHREQSRQSAYANVAAPRPAPDVLAYRADQQKAVVVVVVVSFVALITVALVGAPRRSDASATREAVARSRGDMRQVEHLARTAVASDEALRHEREERRRSDENVHIQSILLNQALGEKLRLGRDLHDGIIQSLYATGLTFESSRQKRADDPAAADALFERGLGLLNENIREIRAYIASLAQAPSPASRGFSQALAVLLENLKAGRDVTFSVRVDEAAEARLDPTQLPDLLQIAREAVSNALRHGKATQVTVRLHEDGGRLALLVSDNGRGFDPGALARTGHGLANFQARAALLRAELRVESRPGDGARVLLTFPALPDSAS